jgi:hypothetical protein
MQFNLSKFCAVWLLHCLSHKQLLDLGPASRAPMALSPLGLLLLITMKAATANQVRPTAIQLRYCCRNQ